MYNKKVLYKLRLTILESMRYLQYVDYFFFRLENHKLLKCNVLIVHHSIRKEAQLSTSVPVTTAGIGALLSIGFSILSATGISRLEAAVVTF